MPAPLRLRGFEFEAGFEPEAAVFVDRGAVLTVPAGMVPAGAVAAAVVPTTGMEPIAEVWVPDEPVAVGAAPLGRVRVRGVTATPPCVQACSYSDDRRKGFEVWRAHE